MKKIAAVLAGIVMLVGGGASLLVVGAPGDVSADTQYWAEISCNQEGVCTVLRVIVATTEFIQSGAVGDPANWVETSQDGSKGGPTYASKGFIYDAVNQEFIRARPSGNFVYNTQTREWEHVEKPKNTPTTTPQTVQ